MKAAALLCLAASLAFGEEPSIVERWKAQAAAAQADDAAMRARCGAAYDQIEIGMSKKKFLDCVEILDVKYKDAKVTVYEVGTSFVRVEHNKVSAVLAK